MSLFQDRKLPVFLLAFLVLCGSLLAQEPVPVERSSNKVILEGTVYYIHVVMPGQTLYSIARAYNISQKELAVENPGVVSGLQLGQALKIPVVPAMEVEVDTSKPEEETDEQRFHIVQAGETLYRISRTYDLTEEDLLEANEGIEITGLQPGQKIRIPDPEQVDEEPSFNEEGYIYHKVKRRETLYSIGKFYEVSVHDLRAANSELGWGGPKTGQVIRIPQPQVIDQPSTLGDTATIDSLSYALSDSVYEEYNFDELYVEHDNRRRTYRIAFFIPFDFREPEPLDTLLQDVKSIARRNRIIEEYMIEEKEPQAVNFLEFFQGSLLAIDSLRKTGMKLEVRYFDTRKSVDETLSILMEDDLEDYDLFFGPFYPFNLELVSVFAKKHKIPLVTPFHNDLELISTNPYLFQLSPSIETEYRDAARLIASKHTYNIVYVREEDTLNIEKHNYFKQLIFDGFDEYHPEEPVVFKEVLQQLKHTDEIIHSLSPDKKNLVVVATRNEALASRVMSSLFFQLKDYEIEVMGTPFWTEFSSIELRYFHALNLIFYSSFWVDYLDPGIDAFMKKYRSQYLNEPTATTRKGINYGIIGYDMSFYFLNALRLDGKRFILSLDTYRPELVQEAFTLKRVSRAGGFENQNVRFYQYTPDMKIRQLEVPDYPVRRYYFRPMEDPKRRRWLNMDPKRNWP